MTDINENDTVSTLDTALSIVHVIESNGALTLSEIATELEISTSTVHRHLNTLRSHGYLVREGTEYRLGMPFLTLGGRVQTNKQVFDLAKQKVDQLAAETGERVQFVVEENGLRYYLYTQSGENAVQTDASIGKSGPLHVSASSKAILAELPEARVDEIIEEHGLSASTEQTITDREELFEELDTIRESGVAYNNEEATPGLRAVGAAVCDPDGFPVGGLSISGPANRFKDDLYREKLPNLVLAAVNELELKLAYEVN
ncbi:IclR family transcriptional regulator [Halorubrum sp. HHNYT27]|uniref:IclR family transcriptional regulator n=1 Tax=Halorubrum sp. HHNYT27 TaxID=3402275 RepID=UPI003EBA0329